MKRYISLVGTIVSFCLVLSPNILIGQTRGNQVSMSDGQVVKRTPLIRTKGNVALIIGTDDYKSQHWKKLSNPVYDATTINNLLRDEYNYDTRLLLNPTKEEMLTAIHTLWTDFGTGKYGDGTNLFIFIAGHGSYNAYSKGFIVPSDAKDPGIDVARNSYIEYSLIKDKIDEINANNILFVLDVCNGGAFDDVKIRSKTKQQNTCAALSQNQIDNITISKYVSRIKSCNTRKFIASGTKDESVFDGKVGQHSPFAKEFIQLLRRGAEYSQLVAFGHICYAVQYINSSTPVFKDFGSVGSGGDFVFVPSSIETDGPVSKYYKAAPPVAGYSTGTGNIIILPRSNGQNKISTIVEDPNVRMILSKVYELFESKDIKPVYYDFTAIANINDTKEQIIKKTGADTYIEIDMKVDFDGIDAYAVSLTFTGMNTSLNQPLFTKTYNSGYFRTTDYSELASRILDEVGDDLVENTAR